MILLFKKNLYLIFTYQVSKYNLFYFLLQKSVDKEINILFFIYDINYLFLLIILLYEINKYNNKYIYT